MTRARATVQLGVGGISFLWTYTALHLLHVAGHDPPLVRALGPIPLFAGFVASAACAVVLGAAAGLLARDRAPGLRRLPQILPRILAVSAAVLALAVVVFP